MADETHRTTATIIDWIRDPSDPRAWQEFSNRYHAKIQEWCKSKSIGSVDSEEIAQNIISNMGEKIRSYKPEKGKFRVWLRSVTKNACNDFYRDQNRRKFHEFEFAATRDAFEQHLDDQGRKEILLIAMEDVRASVKAHHWKIFAELVFDGKSGKEVAEEMEISVASAFMTKHRIQERIKRRVGELGEDEQPGGESP